MSSSLATVYTPTESNGVIALVTAACISLVSIALVALYLVYQKLFKQRKLFPKTNVGIYCSSLLLANAIQSAGGVASVKWVEDGGVSFGPVCTLQGGWKNAGNNASAIFAFVIAAHIFNCLFLRIEPSFALTIASTALGWAIALVIVLVGPVIIEPRGLKLGKGPYFGPSGLWCWITRSYPGEQVGLEYIWMFTGAGLSFVIYMLVFLRMRGNIVGHGKNTRFIWVKRSDTWKLRLSRDEVDRSMYGMVQRMIWFPVAYTVLIIPIAIARFTNWAGHEVPFQITIFADFLFNMAGTVNAVLLLITRAIVPEYINCESLATRRATVDLTTAKGLGVTPFVLPPLKEAV